MNKIFYYPKNSPSCTQRADGVSSQIRLRKIFGRIFLSKPRHNPRERGECCIEMIRWSCQVLYYFNIICFLNGIPAEDRL